MTQINFTLDSQQIQDIITNSGANEVAKQMLTMIFNQLMEKERDHYINADNYSRDSERVSSRNGYYDRSYTTRVGRLELAVPRTRDGEFSPSVFERYQRNEKALLSTMLEMYVQGVSTRKVSKVVEELCGTSVSKSFVSTLTSELDLMVNSFLNRPLERKYPFIFSDVLYIKVRESGRVISKAFHVVLGINDIGERELLSFSVSDTESYETWKQLYLSLIDRGLKGLKLVISDAHKGEVAAIREVFVGVSWQRCQVHFMRNVFDKLPRKNTETVRDELKVLFKTNNIEIARTIKNSIVKLYSDKYQKMVECLDEGFEDSFQYCSIDETNYSRLKSTNMLERVNSEIRRREKVVRIFPNEQSALRLIGAVLIDIHEDWQSSSRQYISFTESTKKWIG
ncbi:IS256 family transposase [Erysipelothrix urinaevulpis]|uniref:IS256 family transposase n=1 Tax=Erysipelothrix urinaevulpis TaxID=2683717 RepID=UPI00135C89B3|nr:IS256 family transposase [Erysipelothrix urinaevulpis]